MTWSSAAAALWRLPVAKRKEIRAVITLECTEARALGARPSRYTTTKNRQNTAERLELRKYNPYQKRHTIHKELR